MLAGGPYGMAVAGADQFKRGGIIHKLEHGGRLNEYGCHHDTRARRQPEYFLPAGLSVISFAAVNLILQIYSMVRRLRRIVIVIRMVVV